MDEIKLGKLRLPYGSKWRGGNRCTSVNLSQETRDAIDELVPNKYRSAWIERWCKLGIAVQTGDREKIDAWVEWLESAADNAMAYWIAFSNIADKMREDVS